MSVVLTALFAVPGSAAAKKPGEASITRDWEGVDDRRAVPDLTGQPLKNARQVLRLAKLSSSDGVFYIRSDLWRQEIRPESVGLQVPRAGARSTAGSAVGLWKFAPAEEGQKIVETPDLRGLSRDRAATTLTHVGLVLMKPVDAVGSSEGPGPLVVVDQYPQPGQSVYERTSVMIRLGTAFGRDQTTSPTK